MKKMTAGEKRERQALRGGLDPRWAYVLRVLTDQPEARLTPSADGLTFTLIHTVGCDVPMFSGTIPSLTTADEGEKKA